MVDTIFYNKSSPFGSEEKSVMQKKLPLFPIGLYCVRATLAGLLQYKNSWHAESPCIGKMEVTRRQDADKSVSTVLSNGVSQRQNCGDWNTRWREPELCPCMASINILTQGDSPSSVPVTTVDSHTCTTQTQLSSKCETKLLNDVMSECAYMKLFELSILMLTTSLVPRLSPCSDKNNVVDLSRRPRCRIMCKSVYPSLFLMHLSS